MEYGSDVLKHSKQEEPATLLPVCFPFQLQASMTTVSYSVSEVILASRARFNRLTKSFSQGHDPITHVHRARFLTDVGGALLSVSCHVMSCVYVVLFKNQVFVGPRVCPVVCGSCFVCVFVGFDCPRLCLPTQNAVPHEVMRAPGATASALGSRPSARRSRDARVCPARTLLTALTATREGGGVLEGGTVWRSCCCFEQTIYMFEVSCFCVLDFSAAVQGNVRRK